MDLDTLASAFAQWINTFPLSRPCRRLEDLTDGVILHEVLIDIDATWFKTLKILDAGPNWVLKFNNLKKLYKLVIGFYESVLRHSTSSLDVPNLTSIARDGDLNELLKLSQIVIALAVQSENNQKYIMKIQSLDNEGQQCMMIAIEEVISRLAAPGSSVTMARSPTMSMGGPMSAYPSSDPSGFDHLIPNAILAEKQTLEKENRELLQQIEIMRSQMENMEDGFGGNRRRTNTKSSYDDKDATIPRTEFERLKIDLEKSEEKRLEYSETIETQTTTINELFRRVGDANKKEEEYTLMKEELTELRTIADRLQKSELMIEKYKKKLEESSDLRRQIRIVEDSNQQLNTKLSQLEDDNRQMQAFKTLLNTYKEQIGNLESKNSSLQLDNSRYDFELKEARGKLDRNDLERREDMERINMLEDQLRELEFNGHIPGHDTMDTGLAKELAIDRSNDAATQAMRKRIAELENQLSHMKTIDIAGDRIVALESQLNDVERLKNKFEQDYMQSYQKNLGLENEIQQLRSVSKETKKFEKSGGESKARSFPEHEAQVRTLKKRITELEEMINGAYNSNNMDIQQEPSSTNEQETTTISSEDQEKFKKKLQILQDETRSQMATINKLLMEKESLQQQNIEVKEILLQNERLVVDLKSVVASLESIKYGGQSDETMNKLSSATKKVVVLSEQCNNLHKALKKTKEHILMQDKQIKDLRSKNPSENYAEAIKSLEISLKERDFELERIRQELLDTRTASRREQKLMISAWSEMGMTIQRKNVSNGITNGIRNEGGLVQQGSSWLAQQRKGLDNQFRRK